MTGNHKFEKYLFGYDEKNPELSSSSAIGIPKYVPRCVFCGLIDDRKLKIENDCE